MIKIEGLDQLSRQFDEAQKGLSQLDDEVGSVRFDPHDPESIEDAVQKVESMIDEKLGTDIENPIIASLAQQMKDKYRDGIIELAATSRLSGSNQNEE
jgi:hypothetical protein